MSFLAQYLFSLPTSRPQSVNMMQDQILQLFAIDEPHSAAQIELRIWPLYVYMFQQTNSLS